MDNRRGIVKGSERVSKGKRAAENSGEEWLGMPNLKKLEIGPGVREVQSLEMRALGHSTSTPEASGKENRVEGFRNYRNDVNNILSKAIKEQKEYLREVDQLLELINSQICEQTPSEQYLNDATKKMIGLWHYLRSTQTSMHNGITYNSEEIHAILSEAIEKQDKNITNLDERSGILQSHDLYRPYINHAKAKMKEMLECLEMIKKEVVTHPEKTMQLFQGAIEQQAQNIREVDHHLSHIMISQRDQYDLQDKQSKEYLKNNIRQSIRDLKIFKRNMLKLIRGLSHSLMKGENILPTTLNSLECSVEDNSFGFTNKDREFLRGEIMNLYKIGMECDQKHCINGIKSYIEACKALDSKEYFINNAAAKFANCQAEYNQQWEAITQNEEFKGALERATKYAKDLAITPSSFVQDLTVNFHKSLQMHLQ